MDKIENITDIESLTHFADSITKFHKEHGNSKAIRDSKNEYKTKTPFWVWDFNKKCAESGVNVLNQKYSVLQEYIPISPEVACLIAIEASAYYKKKSKQDWAVGKHTVTIPFSVFYAVLFPNPMSIGNAGREVKSFVDALRKDFDVSAKIEAEANQTVQKIAALYHLTEPSPGKYVLQRNEWYAGISDAGSTMHTPANYDPMIGHKGIDKSVDMLRIKLFVDKKVRDTGTPR